MNAIIFHGTDDNPDRYWYKWLGKELKDGDWEYKNDFSGDASNFKGHEEIHYKGELVFVHDYFGGLLKDGRK